MRSIVKKPDKIKRSNNKSTYVNQNSVKTLLMRYVFHIDTVFAHFNVTHTYCTDLFYILIASNRNDDNI